MDVTEIRRRNITLLIEQFGGPTEFGRRIERDQAQVSQWTSPANPKPIGGRLARHIESKLGHTVGWMDQPQWESETAPESHSQSVRLDPEIVRDVARALQEVYRDELGRVYDIVEEPELFAEFYERAAALGDTKSQSNIFWLGTRIKGSSSASLGAPMDERRKSTHHEGATPGKAGDRRAKG